MSSQLLTPDAQTALSAATQAARDRHSQYVDVEHLLLGLLSVREEPLGSLWEKYPQPDLTHRLQNDLGMVREDPLEQITGLSANLQTVFRDAAQQSQRMQHEFINAGHLLLAAMEQDSLRPYLAPTNIRESVVREHIRTNSPKPKNLRQQQNAILTAERNRRRAQQSRPKSQASPDSFSRGTAILVAVAVVYVMMAIFNTNLLLSFGFVLAVWVFSVTLHEFAHAIVAYWGGDYTVKDKGYLTFNPLRYTHPLLSIGIPILFILMGGIGLPGGAVYIETHRLRSPLWRTAVSLAGPAANAIFAVILAMPFILGMYDLPFFYNSWDDFGRFESALAFSVMLQVTAIMLNLLPFPPLDGFNAISPYLPRETVAQLSRFGLLPLFLIFFLFSVPSFNNAFFDQVDTLLELLQVDPLWWRAGFNLFRFWES